MKERLENLLDKLNGRRDQILEEYLKILEDYDGHRAATNAGALHDIDRHITNVILELKRMGAIGTILSENGKEN